MSKISIEDLADDINESCDTFKYLYAFRLIGETLSIWEDPKLRALLCEAAQMMVDQHLEGARP